MNAILQGGADPQPDQQQRWQRIPAELRQRPQWCISPGLDHDKAPRSLSGALASSTTPSTWGTFEAACDAAANRGWFVGYMLHVGDPFTCIDLDVKDGTPAEQLERHDSIVSTMASYTERSRSGRGRHVWVRGQVGRGCKRDGVEVYSQERYIICTGDVVCDLAVEDRQDLVSNMAARMRPAVLADAELRADEVGDDQGCCIAGIAHADLGELGRLMRGEWQGLDDTGARKYPSQSEADLALVIMLARLTASNGACREAFRLSPLGRREKARCDDRYLNLTLRKARSILSDEAFHVAEGSRIMDELFWPEPAWTPPGGGSPGIRLLLDGDLDALPPLRWLVKGIIPDAGIGAIYGASGTFKSFLTLDLLAHVSNGREWFGHRVKATPAVYVPFEGQGGIPNRIKAWRTAQTALRHPDRLATFEPDVDVLSRVAVVMEPLNLRNQVDRDRLVAGLRGQGWSGGVLCIDTLAHASAGIEENSSAMGEMISVFRDLQQQLGGVILLVHHSGKDESRGMRGWSGLHAAMDFVVECQKEGDAGAATFRLSKVKDGTTGTSFGFQMQVVPVGVDEDGDAVTSLTVCPVNPREAADHPFVVDGLKEAGDDDAFVEAWVRELMIEGSKPTGRWLEASRRHIQDKRKITQKRLRDAICRLKASGRLEDAPDDLVKNGKWLRAVDVPQAV